MSVVPATVVDTLRKMYGMEVVDLSPADINVFRSKTRSVYDKWAAEIGVDLVRSADKIVESAN